MEEQAPNKKQLLSELDALHGFLEHDDSALPVLQAEDDGQLPLLVPEVPVKHQQPKGSAASVDVKKELASRTNPFLLKANELAQSKIAQRSNNQEIANSTAEQPQAESQQGGNKLQARLSQGEINKLVDAVLDECLPHIEQTLRIHLTASLHRLNRHQ